MVFGLSVLVLKITWRAYSILHNSSKYAIICKLQDVFYRHSMTPSHKKPRTQDLERLLEISRKLNSTQDLDTLLTSIVEAAQELIQCEASSILLYDEDAQALKFVAAPISQKEELKNMLVPLKNSVAGRVYRECQPVIIQDGKSTPDIFRKVDKKLTFETRDLLAAPLLFRDDPIGVIEVINKEGGDPFTADDIHILETLASHAATAIQNTRLLEEVQLAYAELEQLDHLKSNFISIASHELRTPIGLVLGYSSVLKETATDKDIRSKIDVIHKSALRLKRVVEDLDQMDRSERGQAQVHRGSVRIAALIQKTISELNKKAAAKEISIKTEIQDKDLIITGDEKKITTILTNIIDNAIAFTPKGGRVLISTEKISGYMKCSIIDNGISIPAKDLPRVFDRFFQVENPMTRKHEGIGLGLSVAKTLVELHKGEIWAQSVEGKGSNFSFLLPIGSKMAFVENKVFI